MFRLCESAGRVNRACGGRRRCRAKISPRPRGGGAGLVESSAKDHPPQRMIRSDVRSVGGVNGAWRAVRKARVWEVRGPRNSSVTDHPRGVGTIGVIVLRVEQKEARAAVG